MSSMHYRLITVCTLLLGLTSCGFSGMDSGNGTLSSSSIDTAIERASQAEKKLEEQGTSRMATPEERIAMRDAVMNMDPTQCLPLEGTRELQRCQMVVYTSLAARDNDISYCEKIPMKTSAEACVDAVVLQKSISEENRELCDTLTDEDRILSCKDNFSFTLAQNTENPSLCKEIETKEVSEQCHDTVVLKNMYVDTVDANMCANLMTDAAQQECATFLSEVDQAKNAIATGTMDVCNTLTNSTARTYCVSELTLATVATTKDGAMCSMMTDGFMVSKETIKDYLQECRSLISEESSATNA